jgi:two-component system response regulator RpaA
MNKCVIVPDTGLENLLTKHYTTGQVAKLLQVAPRTVTKWFDSGELKGHRLPMSADRRIPHYELIKFMCKNDVPLYYLRNGQWECFAVSEDKQLTDAIQQRYDIQDLLVRRFGSIISATAVLFQIFPDIVIFDEYVSSYDTIEFTNTVLKYYRPKMMVLLCNEDRTDEYMQNIHDQKKYDLVLKRPFDLQVVINRVLEVRPQLETHSKPAG